MPSYSFTIPSFQINQIRSAHTDTLVASTSLRVMNANGSLHNDFGPQGVFLGDRKAGGGVDLTLAFKNVDVPPPTAENPDGGAVYWTFLLVNNGHGDPQYVPVLNKAADAFAGAIAGKVLDPQEAGLAGSLGALAALGVVLGVQEALNLLTANCDGQVAGGAFALTAAQLSAKAPNPGQRFDTSQDNPGTDSPAGCGSNSDYSINYRIERNTDSLLQYLSEQGVQPAPSVSVRIALHLAGPASSLRSIMGL